MCVYLESNFGFKEYPVYNSIPECLNIDTNEGRTFLILSAIFADPSLQITFRSDNGLQFCIYSFDLSFLGISVINPNFCESDNCPRLYPKFKLLMTKELISDQKNLINQQYIRLSQETFKMFIFSERL